MSKSKTLTLFVFVILCFILLAVRVEVNDGRIKDNTELVRHTGEVNTYVNCIGRNEFRAAYNDTQRKLADLELKAAKIDLEDPLVHKERAVILLASVVPILDCGTDPR